MNHTKPMGTNELDFSSTTQKKTNKKMFSLIMFDNSQLL